MASSFSRCNRNFVFAVLLACAAACSSPETPTAAPLGKSVLKPGMLAYMVLIDRDLTAKPLDTLRCRG